MQVDNWSSDFGPFEGRVWLNAAHQGAMPRIAADAAYEAVRDRVNPHRIQDSAFSEVPQRLHKVLAQLIGAAAEQIVLGNSASYGLDLLAHGLSWKKGDEVLLVEGDFPASIYPWRILEREGVRLRFIVPRVGNVPDPDEVLSALTARTRLFCTSWVNSFTGHTLDVQAIGKICWSEGVKFVLNASQALGARSLDVSNMPIDALTCCGYKWLMGPYGTGFAWFSPTLLEGLSPTHYHWLAQVWSQPGGLRQYSLRSSEGAEVHDLFCPGNFLNFIPWTVALEYLLEAGPELVERHNQALVGDLIGGLKSLSFELLSPEDGERRSTLVVVRPPADCEMSSVEALERKLFRAGIDVAVREEAIRLSPHLYNTCEEINYTLKGLHRVIGH